ncbi:MAG TPA: M20 family metallopeptidase [Pyrinomonadaceae bacterium]|nr:M20 family metallopeptidase [Pyrinomonadaceae bacterium]
MSQIKSLSQPNETGMKIRAEELRDDLVAIRRTIHAHPEYGFQEHETARLIAETMSNLGARVRTGVAKTGVVAELGNGAPIVAIRADMDALPFAEATGLSFASQVPNMMHACGHDAHVACALGAAMLLSEESVTSGFAGTVRFLFQPSEEQRDEDGHSGAVRMIDEGALDSVDAVIALHTKPLPVGSIGVTSGPALAANDTIRITIQGRAAHGAHPEEGVDAIAIAAQVIGAIQLIVSRRMPAISPGVVSITTIHGGVKENVIAERVELGGTIRSTGGVARLHIIDELERAMNVGRALGATCELTVIEGYAATINDDGVTETIRAAATELLGPAQVIDMPFDPWAEDFGYMTARVPGSMFWLGVTSKRVPNPIWHSATFDLDEGALPIGAMVLAASALSLLKKYS